MAHGQAKAHGCRADLVRPYTAADFRRQDESDDEGFYNAPETCGKWQVWQQVWTDVDRCGQMWTADVHKFGPWSVNLLDLDCDCWNRDNAWLGMVGKDWHIHMKSDVY